MPSLSLHLVPTRFRLPPLVLALTLAAAGAQAQSLGELYEAARAYDASYQSARAQADAAGHRLEQSRALRRPAVSATGNLSYSRSETPYASTLSATSQQQSVGLAAQQSLFNRGNDKTITQAERGVEVAQAQLASAEQDLIVRVAQAYFDVLAAGDALSTVQASQKAIAEQLASAKRNFEVGTATITDTREAQARFDLASAQELAARNDLDVKRLALETLVGRAGLAPRPLAVPVALPALVPAEAETWVRQADEASPALQQLRLAREVARLETEKARTGHLPTVGVSAALTEAHTRVRGDLRNTVTGAVTSYGPSSGSGLSGNVGVQINVPIFSGFSVQNRIKETLSLEEKAQADLDAARRSVAQGTRSAFFGVNSLRAQVGALEAAESSSKLALEATQLGYKVGVRVNLDVLNAQAQLFQAQRDLAKARYDTIVTGLRLRQAAGLLAPVDVQAVDALLAK